ncbi:MAG: hypothetical protein JNN12_12295 [Bacteroidetes Order II. Incertae sedis bacterium]|nr:hypothetical protein [Bacteroidetes Order II. bacterium]
MYLGNKLVNYGIMNVALTVYGEMSGKSRELMQVVAESIRNRVVAANEKSKEPKNMEEKPHLIL